MNLADIIKGALPTLATALGGPLAGAAVGFLSKKLGVEPELLQQTVAGMNPQQLVELKKLDYEFQTEMGRQGLVIQQGQMEINKEEAKSTNWFIAGWRPAAGWICVAGLGYAAILEPILRFVATVLFSYTGEFPVLDTVTLIELLFGMLGLGAMRTREKEKNSEGNR